MPASQIIVRVLKIIRWIVLAFSMLMLLALFGPKGDVFADIFFTITALIAILASRDWQKQSKLLGSAIVIVLFLGFAVFSQTEKGKTAYAAEQVEEKLTQKQEAETERNQKLAKANQDRQQKLVLARAAKQQADQQAQSNKAAAAAANPTPEQQLKDLMKNRFGDNLRSIDVIPQYNGGYGVFVAFNLSDNLTQNMTVEGVKLDMKQAYKDLYTSNIDVRQAKMVAYGTLQDKYGKESQDVVYTTSMDKSTGKQINWDNWETLDFDQLWTVQFMNRSFQ